MAVLHDVTDPIGFPVDHCAQLVFILLHQHHLQRRNTEATLAPLVFNPQVGKGPAHLPVVCGAAQRLKHLCILLSFVLYENELFFIVVWLLFLVQETQVWPVKLQEGAQLVGAAEGAG